MLVLKSGVPKLRIDELAFSGDGTAIYAPALSGGLCRWPAITSGAKAQVLVLPAKVIRRIVCAPDGQRVFAGSDELCMFDLEQKSGSLINIPKWAALWFAISLDGKQMAVDEKVGDRETRLTLWSTDSLSSPTAVASIAGLVHSAPAFFPDCVRFIQLEAEQTSANGWVFRRVTRSAMTAEAIDRSDPLSDDPDQMILSPDGSTIACRTRNFIRLYPTVGPVEPTTVIQNGGKQHFTGIAYHPTGRFLAATSNDKTVKLYDAARGTLVKSYDWNIGRLRSVAFSPDGLVAASGSDTGKVIVWDIET